MRLVKELAIVGSLIVSLVFTGSAMVEFFHKAATPILIEAREDTVVQALMKMGVRKFPSDLPKSVSAASKSTGFSETLLLAVMFTESSFRPTVISKKGYAGLMQVPQGPMWKEPEVNALVGAHILKEKLRIASGNLSVAIRLYKGYPDNQRGKEQVQKVLQLADFLNSERG